MNKSKGEKKEQILCICSQNTKSFSIFYTHLFIVDICPSSHPFSVNMGRVCCQTHSSKVSIKVMYFFQNNVEKIQLQVNLVGFFVTYVEKKFEYIINK